MFVAWFRLLGFADVLVDGLVVGSIAFGLLYGWYCGLGVVFGCDWLSGLV